MNKLRTTALVLISFFSSISAILIAQENTKPKLVIGIVVDQMRYDYLYRYANNYNNDGFKKLMSQGFICHNMQYGYVPTFTGPGHASIYSGTTPDKHGIISNNWFERGTNKTVYCVQDDSQKAIGTTETAASGKMSPARMLTTTLGDELKISNINRSKVIGIALKDRGAILPAGHMANAAYWYDGASGNWISSSFYMEKLPSWVSDFNKNDRAGKLLKEDWKPLLDTNRYTHSLPDNAPYEKPFKGKENAVFPYELSKLMLQNGGKGIIKYTPHGNTLTREFAEAVILGENLGKGSETDFLAVSFSTPDYIGHQFGTESRELEDNYIRLDRDIAQLIATAEKQVGKENLIIFLTADHGGATVPAYLLDKKVPGGYFDLENAIDSLNTFIKQAFDAEGWVLEFNDEQIYLNDREIARSKYSIEEVERRVANFVKNFEGINMAITSIELNQNFCFQGTASLIAKGFHRKRSGNIKFTMEPNWIEYMRKGTTHGSPYNYDTRVPMIFYGWNIQSGSSVKSFQIEDIAPTISTFLNIPFPNGCAGNPIEIPLK